MKDYEMGYMKPPKSGQFRPGQSGNPKGRPKGSKNTYKLLDEILNEKVQIVKNGNPIKIPKKLAMLLQAANKAAKVDLKALQILIPLMIEADNKNEELAKVAATIRQDDMTIVKQFLKDNKNG